MIMEGWWNEADRGILRYSEKILPKSYFSHHKSDMSWPGIEHAHVR
jgi:hypothetical protein